MDMVIVKRHGRIAVLVKRTASIPPFGKFDDAGDGILTGLVDHLRGYLAGCLHRLLAVDMVEKRCCLPFQGAQLLFLVSDEGFSQGLDQWIRTSLDPPLGSPDLTLQMFDLRFQKGKSAHDRIAFRYAEFLRRRDDGFHSHSSRTSCSVMAYVHAVPPTTRTERNGVPQTASPPELLRDLISRWHGIHPVDRPTMKRRRSP